MKMHWKGERGGKEEGADEVELEKCAMFEVDRGGRGERERERCSGRKRGKRAQVLTLRIIACTKTVH